MTVRVACNLLVLRAVMFIQKSPKDANDGRLRERTRLNDIESVLQRPDWLAVAATETLETGYCLVKNIRDYYCMLMSVGRRIRPKRFVSNSGILLASTHAAMQSSNDLIGIRGIQVFQSYCIFYEI